MHSRCDEKDIYKTQVIERCIREVCRFHWLLKEDAGVRGCDRYGRQLQTVFALRILSHALGIPTSKTSSTFLLSASSLYCFLSVSL